MITDKHKETSPNGVGKSTHLKGATKYLEYHYLGKVGDFTRYFHFFEKKNKGFTGELLAQKQILETQKGK